MNINFRELLRAIYLNVSLYGYKEISLKNKNIECYIKELENIFEENNIESEDLFVKTSVLETYDKFKEYLITVFVGLDIGYMNEKYDSIIINITNYEAIKLIEKLKDANDIIVKCSKVILNSYKNKEEKEESSSILSTIKRKINKGEKNK